MPNHLECINEDYFTHLFNGLKYSSLSMYASIVFFIHAIVPDILTSEGSDTIFSLSKQLYNRLYKLKLKTYETLSYEERMNVV